MGVTGIHKLIRENRHACMETVDLIGEADKARRLGQGPLEIIVDFGDMREQIGNKIVALFTRPPYNNPYLQISSGEYELIYNIVRNILLQLQASGLKLTFVLDCLKLSNEDEQHAKHQKWLKRLSSKLKDQRRQITRLQNEDNNAQKYIRDFGISKLPWFGHILKGLITELGFECHTPHGQESDFYRAQLQRQRNAFAVLTDDTDYVLFPDCPVLLMQMFDDYGDIKYSTKHPVVAPQRLICGRVVSSQVRNYLQLSSHDQFIDMSNVMGNLFTKSYVIKGRKASHLPVVAAAIRCQSVVTQRNSTDPQKFTEACHKAREYFNLRSDPLKLDVSVYANDPILTFLASPENLLRLGDYPSRLRCRAYWPFALLEDHRIISHQEALMGLLCRVFAFVHKISENASVYVYFRARNSAKVDMTLVQPVASGDGSTVEEIMAENVEDNMKRFAEVMKCYRGTEQNSTNEETDRMSDMLNPNDFMRAFLVFCWRLALDVEPEPGYFTDGGHLLALTTSMLTLWDPEVREEVMPLLEQLYAVRIVPTPSQVTIFNWMQIIVITANDCALFLYLERFLSPILPRMFSFSLFLAYVHIRDVEFHGRPELRASLETVQSKVMEKYSDLLELVK